MTNRLFSVAPMLNCTDRHCRYLYRLLTKSALLYTEMLHVNAILQGDRDRYLSYNECEHPLALQLAGNDAKSLAIAAKVGQDYGYDEINLNVGCPSPRVQKGGFGASLFLDTQLVATCIKEMSRAVKIPVTVKIRLGIIDKTDESYLINFVEQVANAGCEVFIVHARYAKLANLSPKQNLNRPELNYAQVYALKQRFADLQFVINGGIKTVQQIQEHLLHVDGVMLGREIYRNPYFLANVDKEIFQQQNNLSLTREQVADEYLRYAQQQRAPRNILMHPLLGLYYGTPGAKKWRKKLMGKPGYCMGLLAAANLDNI